MDIIPGYNGYVRVADNAPMEQGANSTAEWSGYTGNRISANNTYVPPFRVYDISATWSNENNARDNSLATYAEETIPLTSWSGNLTFSVPRTDSRYIRYYFNREVVAINAMVLEAYYGGAWHTIFSGDPGASLQWWYRDLGAQTAVEQIRVRVYNNDGVPRYFRLYEMQSDHAGEIIVDKPQAFSILNTGDNVTACIATGENVTAHGLTSPDDIVKFTTDTTSLKSYLNGVLQETVALSTGVPANSNNWTLFSEVPYTNYYKHYVGGNLIAWYQPNTIILGTVLLDRQGADQNGVITWGANPANVSVTLGSMTSSGQPSIGATRRTNTRDILPPAGGTDWRPNAGVSVKLQANPMRPIVRAVSDNTTLTEYQVWVWLGIIFVAFITILVGSRVRGHHLITGIAVSAAVVLMIVWTVFPPLTWIIIVIAIVGGLISERSHSL